MSIDKPERHTAWSKQPASDYESVVIIEHTDPEGVAPAYFDLADPNIEGVAVGDSSCPAD